METLGLLFFISGYGGIGRLVGFRFRCQQTCGFEPRYPDHIYIRDHNMSYYGEEMIDMLKFIKKHVLMIMYHYHYHISNYYYKKGEWNDRIAKHADKEFKLVEKLVQLEGI